MIEVDTGSHRGGVSVGAAVDLAGLVNALPGLRVRGVYAYEGYQYSAPDRAALASRSLTADVRGSGVCVTVGHGLPNHICPVVNLFDEVYGARNG